MIHPDPTLVLYAAATLVAFAYLWWLLDVEACRDCPCTRARLHLLGAYAAARPGVFLLPVFAVGAFWPGLLLARQWVRWRRRNDPRCPTCRAYLDASEAGE